MCERKITRTVYGTHQLKSTVSENSKILEACGVSMGVRGKLCTKDGNSIQADFKEGGTWRDGKTRNT